MDELPTERASHPVLQARNLTKRFGGVLALDGVDFDLSAGEIHALVGENGAGKSTLMKLFGGVYRPDGGHLVLDGETVSFGSPSAAQRAGIGNIHQEPSLFPDLDVAENVFIGNQPRRGYVIRRDEMLARTRAILEVLGVDLDPRLKVYALSLAERQIVDMASALARRARVLLVDEPTAALTPAETGRLFVNLRKLRDDGVGIVFIGHRLEEVFEIADRITVMRDGKRITTQLAASLTIDDVIRAMVGRELGHLYERARKQQGGEPVLEVVGLRRQGVFDDITFAVHAGEIVGLAGLVGAGRSEVARSIFGIDPLHGGRVRMNGRDVVIRNPGQAVASGIAYLPEDRQTQGLALSKSIASNVSLTVLREVSRWGLMQPRRERSLALEFAQRLRLRARGMDQVAGELSGGNQQKVVLAKWLVTRPQLLILDEPTRGVDVATKTEIHHMIGELTDQGMAVMVISSELPEVLALSDRVLVMRGGRIVVRYPRAEATPERVMAAAAGVGDAQRV